MIVVALLFDLRATIRTAQERPATIEQKVRASFEAYNLNKDKNQADLELIDYEFAIRKDILFQITAEEPPEASVPSEQEIDGPTVSMELTDGTIITNLPLDNTEVAIESIKLYLNELENEQSVGRLRDYEEVRFTVLLMIIPPFVVLVLGGAVRWIYRGFAAKRFV